MKKLLIGLTLLASMSSFASSDFLLTDECLAKVETAATEYATKQVKRGEFEASSSEIVEYNEINSSLNKIRVYADDNEGAACTIIVEINNSCKIKEVSLPYCQV